MTAAAEEIAAELPGDDLVPGDVIDDWGGRDATFTIETHEPPTTLVHSSRRGDLRISWAIVLRPAGGTGTRVHLRFRLAGVRGCGCCAPVASWWTSSPWPGWRPGCASA